MCSGMRRLKDCHIRAIPSLFEVVLQASIV
jgi:hypothetical protein